MDLGWPVTKDLDIDRQERERKLKSILFIVRAIPDFKTRIMPHIDQQEATVFWPSLELKFKTESEAIALQWMRAIWFETAPFHSGVQFRLWTVDIRIKEALCSGEIPAGSVALATLWKTDCKIKEVIESSLVFFKFLFGKFRRFKNGSYKLYLY